MTADHVQSPQRLLGWSLIFGAFKMLLVHPQYVVECFMSSSLFHKALKEAFEAFCNKQVAGCTIAEIMANFCNNLLKRVCCLILSCVNLHHVEVC